MQRNLQVKRIYFVGSSLEIHNAALSMNRLLFFDLIKKIY